ncbi:hypothetical protein [Tateyamaria sp. syn59]|uniref:hypothetical protein n=1 Tax=Tateyamaria sp. syn59 TaxID=2576942 RepID=UPI0011BDF0BB|nr:hypothetical protein [Tateyamaria sp. syn59]
MASIKHGEREVAERIGVADPRSLCNKVGMREAFLKCCCQQLWVVAGYGASISLITAQQGIFCTCGDTRAARRTI